MIDMFELMRASGIIQVPARAQRRGSYHLAWYVVAAIVLFALGATILLGAIAWCSSKGMYFGAVETINAWSYRVGCFSK